MTTGVAKEEFGAIRKISSMERVIPKAKGEVNEVRVTTGWERVRAEIDSGATDAAGPNETAKAVEVKETEMPKGGIGYIAAKGVASRTTVKRKPRATPIMERA